MKHTNSLFLGLVAGLQVAVLYKLHTKRKPAQPSLGSAGSVHPLGARLYAGESSPLIAAHGVLQSQYLAAVAPLAGVDRVAAGSVLVRDRQELKFVGMGSADAPRGAELNHPMGKHRA